MPGPLTCRVAQESQRLEEQHRWTGLPFTRLTRKMEEEREAEPMKRADGRTCGGGESGGGKTSTAEGKFCKKTQQSLRKDGWLAPSEVIPSEALPHTRGVPPHQPFSLDFRFAATWKEFRFQCDAAKQTTAQDSGVSTQPRRFHTYGSRLSVFSLHKQSVRSFAMAEDGAST